MGKKLKTSDLKQIVRQIDSTFVYEGEVRSPGSNGYPVYVERDSKKLLIKIIPEKPEMAANERAKLLAMKEKPGDIVVPLLDSGKIDYDGKDVHYLIFPRVDGETVYDICKGGKVWTNDEIRKLGAQLAEGVRDMVTNDGITHQDIKPKNLMIDSASGDVKILDLGIATFRREDWKDLAKGPRLYASPEQIAACLHGDSAVVSFPSDHFMIGAVLYFTATGEYPFGEGSAKEINNVTPTQPGNLRDDLDTDLSEIIMKLLEKEPFHRYASPEELLSAFARKPYVRKSKFHNTPLFLQHGDPAFLADHVKLYSAATDETPDGIVFPLSKTRGLSHLKDFRDLGMHVVLDPETTYLPMPLDWQTPKFVTRAYNPKKRLTNMMLANKAERLKIVKGVLAEEQKNHATIWVSPYVFISGLDDVTLDAQVAFYSEMRKELDDAQLPGVLLGGIALDAGMVRDKKNRNALLNRLMFDPSCKVDGFYLKCDCFAPTAYMPIRDAEYMEGLMEIVGSLSRKYDVILASADTEVFPLMTVGLSGFSANWQPGKRRWSKLEFSQEPSDFKRPPYPRYLAPLLLNALKEADALNIKDIPEIVDTIKCSCVVCVTSEILGNSDPVSRAYFMKLHHNAALAALVSEIKKISTPAAVESKVKEMITVAIKLYGEIYEKNPTLNTESKGTFLEPWRQLLEI